MADEKSKYKQNNNKSMKQLKIWSIMMLMALMMPMSTSAQNIKNDSEPYEVYCAFHGELQVSGKFKPKRFLWGEEKDEIKLTDKNGKKLEFNNMVDIANYLAKRGWKVRDCETFSSHIFIVFAKTIRNDSEAKEGLYFTTDFK
jgi:hypothetical protein